MLTDVLLPDGVLRYDLDPHADERGILTELYRSDWSGAPSVLQVNWVRSSPNVLRGVHVHEHSDWLIVISGRMNVGLFDARSASATFGLAAMVLLDAAVPVALRIPSGVAHGFYTAHAASFIYGLTARWEHDRTMVIRWDDPGLGLRWPCEKPIVSERDAVGLPLREVLEELAG